MVLTVMKASFPSIQDLKGRTLSLVYSSGVTSSGREQLPIEDGQAFWVLSETQRGDLWVSRWDTWVRIATEIIEEDIRRKAEKGSN